MSECEHKWVFFATVYSYVEYYNGTKRKFEDAFHCEKCLSIRHINPREEGDSWSPHIPGTIPK